MRSKRGVARCGEKSQQEQQHGRDRKQGIAHQFTQTRPHATWIAHGCGIERQAAREQRAHVVEQRIGKQEQRERPTTQQKKMRKMPRARHLTFTACFG
jgi:hypothetical protein